MNRVPDLSRGRRKVVHDVNVFGWHVMNVFPSSGDPGWSYSIGLFQTWKHPEILVFGLSGPTRHAILNNVAEAVKAGAAFQDGAVSEDILEGFPVRFRQVAERWLAPLVGFARWFYNGQSFPLLQLFWPDKQGLFPWESACDPTGVPLQPLLFHPELEATNAAGLLSPLEG